MATVSQKEAPSDEVSEQWEQRLRAETDLDGVSLSLVTDWKPGIEITDDEVWAFKQSAKATLYDAKLIAIYRDQRVVVTAVRTYSRSERLR